MDSGQAQEALDLFRAHLETRFVSIGVDNATVQLACELIDRHPLRAYDALRLSTFVLMRGRNALPATFLCADRNVVTAAVAEGMDTLNPERS